MARVRSTISRTIPVLILLFCTCYGQDSGDKSVSVNDGDETGMTPLERGMRPFYDMTRTFLDLVLRENIVERDPALFYGLVNASTSDSNTNADKLSAYVTENWQSVLATHAAFFSCVLVGILFIILMPIVGLFFCCCRICGNCGGKVNPREGAHHKCRQYTCGTILFICNTIMLIGLVFAFMTNEQIRMNTSARNGLVSKAADRINSLNNYLQSVSDDLGAANRTFGENIDEVVNQILTIGDSAADKLDKETQVETLLQQANDLADGLSEIETLLTTVRTLKASIISQLNNLKNSLNTWKGQADDVLRDCTTDLCNTLKTDISSIKVNVDYEQADLDLDAHNIGNIKGYIDNSLDSYRSIFSDINDRVGNNKGDIENSRADILRNISARLRELQVQVTMVRDDVTLQVQNVHSYTTSIETYGTYEWYVGIGLCCIFLLIVLCYFLALIFGACGEPPYDDVGACNKGVGANLLLAGVGFCFLFGWLLMLICTPSYIVGQITHTDICRPLLPNISQSAYLQVLDEIVMPLYGESFIKDTKPSVIIRSCEQNKGVYEALQLSRVYDVDSFNLENYGIKGKIAVLLDQFTSVNLNSVDIINDDIRAQLDNISNSKLDDLPLTRFTDELNKATLTTDLADIKRRLNQQRDAFRDGGNPTKEAALETVIADLQSVQDDLDQVQGKLGDLRKGVDDLQNKMTTEKAGSTIQQQAEGLKINLEAADSNLKNSGASFLTNFFQNSTTTLYNNILEVTENLKTTIKEDIARCRPAYDGLESILNIFCVEFLNPFNGFWFSFGWTLAFFIPSIISAVHLAGSYRKTEDYDPNDNKSFDEPNFDAYSGGIYPGDNIPLEDYHGRKAAARGGGGGLPNSAYVADRSAPPMPPRDYSPRDNYYRNGGPPAYPGNSGGGYGGGGAGHHGGPTPPNPPHYYNNRPGRY